MAFCVYLEEWKGISRKLYLIFLLKQTFRCAEALCCSDAVGRMD
jgi:hypothetical protein